MKFTHGIQNPQAGGFLLPDCAPSSECPQLVDLWSESTERCGRNISGSAHDCRWLLLQRRHAASTDAARYDRREVAGMANFKMYLLRQFCSNRVEFFTIHRRHRRKNDGPEFWNSNSVIFENFLKFSKRRRAVPLWPIWTTMVVAKLDQSRVLVTKFHQNWSTMKGRSAGQRHTHMQTDRLTDKLGWK